MSNELEKCINYVYKVVDGSRYLIIGHVNFVQTCRLDADTYICVYARRRLILATCQKSAFFPISARAEILLYMIASQLFGIFVVPGATQPVGNTLNSVEYPEMEVPLW